MLTAVKIYIPSRTVFENAGPRSQGVQSGTSRRTMGLITDINQSIHVTYHAFVVLLMYGERNPAAAHQGMIGTN
jgi:hypothetical protein